MTDICIRCELVVANEDNWPHCEPCYQIVCDEMYGALEEVRATENAAEWDAALAKLQQARADGYSFAEAVERWLYERRKPSLLDELDLDPDLAARVDPIGQLMMDEGLGFIEAVERLAREAGKYP